MSATDLDYAFNTYGLYHFQIRFRSDAQHEWEPWIGFNETTQATSGNRIRIGGTTPNYVMARKFGRLLENEYTYAQHERHNFFGFLHYITEGTEVRTFGQSSPSFCPYPGLHDVSSARKLNTDNKVQQKVLEKVRELSVNAAVLAAESSKTGAMVTAKLLALIKAYNQARSGNFRAAANTLAGYSKGASRRRQDAKSWLELQYGWLPLMSDIFGICKELQKVRGKGEFRVFKSKDSFNDSNSEVSVTSEFRDSTEKTIKYTAIAVLKCSRSDTQFQTLQATGVTNPLVVAWELVPLSFVLDWALPITSFLGQFDASVGWTYHSGSLTQISEQESVTTRTSNRPSGYKVHECEGQSRNKGFNFKRTAISSFAGHWTIPYVKDPISAVHLANLMSLIVTSKR